MITDIDRIYIYGSPVLRKKAEKVTEFSEELRILADNMVDTMFGNNGVGLAGPQVGVSNRIFVVDRTFGKEVNDVLIAINPEILESDGENIFEEGCLSVPGIYEDIVRPGKIHFRYQDLDGEVHEIEANDFLARVIQHESDHLDGVLFVDRLGTIKRRLLTKKLKTIAQESENV